jgi:hypothetical protein
VRRFNAAFFGAMPATAKKESGDESPHSKTLRRFNAAFFGAMPAATNKRKRR